MNRAAWPRFLLGLFMVFGLMACAPARKSGLVTVFTSGSRIEGRTYEGVRIPALLRLGDGTLLAFAEGRVHGLADHGDIDLLMARSVDEGTTWSVPEMVADAGDAFLGNPSPVFDIESGVITVLLAWKPPGARGRDIRSASKPPGEVWSIRSTDEGRTWSAPIRARGLEDLNVVRGWRWNVPSPCHGIQLTRGRHAGRLVVAGNHSMPQGDGDEFLGAHLLLSDDGGLTWRVGAIDAAPPDGRRGNVPFPNEGTVAELPDGTLVVHVRDENGPTAGNRAVARSRDGGETFMEPFVDEPAFMAPVCQGALLAGEDAFGTSLLITTMPGHAQKRERLVLLSSYDGGETWSDGKVLYPGSAAYSDLAQLAPGRFLVLAEVEDYRQVVALTVRLP